MSEVLPWITLVVCAGAALARIPSALRGLNPTVFFIFLLATAAAVLSIEQFYMAIDGAIGGINIAHVLLRLIVFATIYLIAVRVTKGFGAPDAHRMIAGRPGLAMRAIFSAALVTVFLMMEPAASSVRFRDASAISARNEALLPYYWAAARGYLAYVSLALLPALLRSVKESLPPLVRTGAALMAAGAVATVAGLCLEFAPPQFLVIAPAVNNGAVVFYISGLILVWLARVKVARPGSHGTSSTQR
ncbi:hypothetical protein [Arthrobacter sp. ISL-65]|uniref:hypothetical protein n=1 Tax=Arthrobacter sp. ISL-65 TaxID=2819112 RepID=UPI001BEC90CB|nr:hypothetical protein [Arthrobacter sp. ISL-65]MBT2547580.1 hypothetical protein [Arthrobacter sp. ISL-65]